MPPAAAPRRPRPGAPRGAQEKPSVLLPLAATIVVVVGAWAVLSWSQSDAEPRCRSAALDVRLTSPSDIGTIRLDRTQVANADTIVRTTIATGRTPQAATVALATAMQESALLNLDHGDEAGPDSRGLFQQRLQFYGDVDVMDPASATRAFLERLDAVDGWQAMPPADAIQSVQRAAYPGLYADWIGPAGTWTDALLAYAQSCPDAGA